MHTGKQFELQFSLYCSIKMTRAMMFIVINYEFALMSACFQSKKVSVNQI